MMFHVRSINPLLAMLNNRFWTAYLKHVYLQYAATLKSAFIRARSLTRVNLALGRRSRNASPACRMPTRSLPLLHANKRKDSAQVRRFCNALNAIMSPIGTATRLSEGVHK
jgi:hypothetical protein